MINPSVSDPNSLLFLTSIVTSIWLYKAQSRVVGVLDLTSGGHSGLGQVMASFHEKFVSVPGIIDIRLVFG